MVSTAGLNLLATAFGNASLGRGEKPPSGFALKPGDEIVVSRAETSFGAAAASRSCPTVPAPPSSGST